MRTPIVFCQKCLQDARLAAILNAKIVLFTPQPFGVEGYCRTLCVRPSVRPLLVSALSHDMYYLESQNFACSFGMGEWGPLLIFVKSVYKMSAWRPFWMPKSCFLTTVPGNFLSCKSYGADVLHVDVALWYLKKIMKERCCQIQNGRSAAILNVAIWSAN